MSIALNKIIGPKVYSLLTKRVVYHGIVWLVLLIILMTYDSNRLGFGFRLLVESINILFYALVVYFNLLFLVPNYLNDKKFIWYCLLLILGAALITPIKILVIYSLYSYIPEMQGMQEKLIIDQNWVFLLTLIIAGISTLFKIISDWIRYQRDRRELQTQTMQSELKFLKSQINPHFLFNTLNNLYALTLKKSDKAPEIVIKLSEMMRYMLYDCNERRVLLSKEVGYIRNYLDLERLRQGKNVEIDFTVVGPINDQRIAPLMFIPFLENSFKHGLNNQISNGFVNMKLKVDVSQIHFTIENSKPERLPALEHRRSGGIGLVNVRRRLNLLYPGHYQLDIKDNPNTYSVDLIIDLDR